MEASVCALFVQRGVLMLELNWLCVDVCVATEFFCGYKLGLCAEKLTRDTPAWAQWKDVARILARARLFVCSGVFFL